MKIFPQSMSFGNSVAGAAGKTLLHWLTRLSVVQQAIVDRLGLNGLYTQIQNSG